MSKPKILIVEDEVIVARDIRQQLVELGYNPVADTSTGEEALELVAQLQPALVLMDIHLAGKMDGISAAQVIRDRFGLPVVFITAFAGDETLGRAKLTQPYGYIIKPFDERELNIVIEIALYKHEAETRLSESEQRLRTIIEHSSQLFYSHGTDHVLTYVSPQAREFLDCEPEEAMVRWTEFLTGHPGNAAGIALTEAAIATGRQQRPFQLELRTRSGRICWVEVRESPVVVDGKTTAIVGALTDITESKRAEDLLALQGTVLTAAANAIVITDRTGAIEWVNPAYTAMTGYPLAEALEKNQRDILKSGRQAEAFYQELWETISAGRVWHGQLVNRRKDGRCYPEEQTITPVRDAAGAITHFIGIKQDLTERHAATAALRRSEEHYRLLFDSNPFPMWLYERSTLRFLAVNEAAVQQYGYTREEFLAMKITDIRPPEDIPALLQVVARSAHRRSGEYRHRTKGGKLLRVEVTSGPLAFDGREARLVLAADITEKKMLEEKLLHTQRLENVGMLAAGIAHDLNNVLAPIMFAAPLLRDSLSTPRDQKILATVSQSAARGAGLVKQILSFARSTGGEILLIQIKHIVRDIISVVEETFPKSIQLEQSVPSELWPVLANATQIHQVLLNLCVNARDAMPEGGTLGLAAVNRRLTAAEADEIPGARAGAWLMLEISDTGTGIPPTVLERIWEPFYTTKPPGKGTGLGLSTVRGIVTGHLGFIELLTAEGKGTTFRVFLPANETEVTRGGSAPPMTVQLGRNELVLVVDDDEAIREVASSILDSFGYRFLSCRDGVEALTVFSAHAGQISLVITDVDMPRLGGGALAENLLKLKPDIKIIAMSGLSQHGADGVAAPDIRKLAHVFLSKPFRPEDLLNAMHRVLHPTTGQA